MTRMSDEFFEKHSLTYEQTVTVEAIRLTTDNIMAVAAEVQGTIEFDPDGRPRLTFYTEHGTRVVIPLGSFVAKNGKELNLWSGRRSELVEVQG